MIKYFGLYETYQIELIKRIILISNVGNSAENFSEKRIWLLS
jgi:hypothetical protein